MPRMCIACRERKEKEDLICIKKNKNKEFKISTSYTDGRSCYICKNADCIALAIKKRSLNRSFKCEVDKKIYEELMSIEKTL
jgi:predicted RNA-binding protein YlxR (DUF448 family)